MSHVSCIPGCQISAADATHSVGFAEFWQTISFLYEIIMLCKVWSKDKKKKKLVNASSLAELLQKGRLMYNIKFICSLCLSLAAE